ncbi:putative DNA-binding transcriptional regulator [Planctomycetes bacterium CA13]|uniref:Putative DNA-binding transcriptional regulator n=1 Tax=Novipirellula herctigrandis TaxID=2527986 RepID=A0A5C5Z941_9BACT|nr:putative DNA-binding transcriptional regulator [Planctomycetes bacterium CA13]
MDARTRLLNAAGPIFALHGFTRATVREICAAADVNIASVGYYFGDKLGLYRGVIAQIRMEREAAFPVPEQVESDPRRELYRLVRTLLSRMLSSDVKTGNDRWEMDLLLREMQSPTPVLAELVRDYFEPMLDRLKSVIGALLDQDASTIEVEQLALSTVGQCLYYRVSGSVLGILIPAQRRQEHYDIESLSQHVTAVMLATTDQTGLRKYKSELVDMNLTVLGSNAKPSINEN